MVWSNPLHHQFPHKPDNSHSCFHLENESLHPQSGAGLTPSTLGLQRSLWEDVNSAPSLLQKRVTQDLLDPWGRAWSTGSVREAEVKSYRTGAETSLRIKAESLEHRRLPLPPALVGWRWGWVGGVHLPYRYQPWPFCGYSQGVVLRGFFFSFFFFKFYVITHNMKLTILTIFKCPRGLPWWLRW